MKEKLKCILLVDDDKATNFLHKIIIEDHGSCEQVVCVSGGKEALDFLSTETNGKYPNPEIIFLDINMPGINGWEFLDAYQQLDPQQKSSLLIVMLTTSLNPYDEERARQIEAVSQFKSKPLTEEMLDELILTYFPENM